MNNYFEDLGLNPNKEYSKEELKKKYRELCQKHHPDKGGDPAMFLKITHAYNMLTDPSYRHEQEKNKINLNISFQVPVDFEDAFFGKNVTVSYNKFEVDETGKLVVKEHQDVHTIIFHYPAGMMGGHDMKLPGGGVKHKDKFGDCLIKFVVKAHPRYQIDGQGNVVTQEKVELETMLKGGTIEVQTLFGLKTVKVPPGSRPGDKIKIKNCGVNRVAHHFIDPHPIFPTKSELKEKLKFNDLSINWKDFQEEQEEEMSKYALTYYLKG